MGRARARFRKKKRKLGKNIISPQNAKKVKIDKNPIGGYAAYKPSGKWWKKRHFLFSKFDQGIIIESNESWYSVTPEEISHSISKFFSKTFTQNLSYWMLSVVLVEIPYNLPNTLKLLQSTLTRGKLKRQDTMPKYIMWNKTLNS